MAKTHVATSGGIHYWQDDETGFTEPGPAPDPASQGKTTYEQIAEGREAPEYGTPTLRNVLTLGGRLGATTEEVELGKEARALAEARGLSPTVENMQSLTEEARQGARASIPAEMPGEGGETELERVLASLPPTTPTTVAPTTAAPSWAGYPGMSSIKGDLARLEQQMKTEKAFQKGEIEAEREAYERRGAEIREQSEVNKAREKMGFAERALGTATEKLKNWEIDPQRAFPNTFSKIAAVIGVAMGAYAQGLSGGKIPNTALQIVNDAIDRDIDAQKTEYAKLKGLVDEKRNVYGMAMRLLGDERQADELLRSAAYRTLNANMTSMGKQFGLTATQNTALISMLKLEERENEARSNLMVNAAKLSGTTAKLPKAMTKAAASFDAMQVTAKSLWDKVGQFSLGPMTGFVHKMTPGEQLGDTFDREAEQSLVEMLHAISGVALSPGEFKRISKFFPKSTKMESTNRADLKGLIDWSAKKGAGLYKTMSPQQQARMAQAVPELVELYLEKDPAKRDTLIVSMLSQQSGGDFFGSDTQVRGQ